MSVIDDRSRSAVAPTAEEPQGALDRALRHALDWLAAQEERPPPGRAPTAAGAVDFVGPGEPRPGEPRPGEPRPDELRPDADAAPSPC